MCTKHVADGDIQALSVPVGPGSPDSEHQDAAVIIMLAVQVDSLSEAV